MALRVWQHQVRVFAKLWRGVMLPPFLDPVIFFMALGFGLGAYVPNIDGIPYRDFVAPGMCVSAALWAASLESTFGFFWRMDQLRIHENMLSTPIEPEDVVLGELLWGGTRSAIYSTTFLIVIALMGYVDSPWALALPPFLFVTGLAFGAVGLAYAVLVPKLEYFTFYFTLVVNPMFFFGGIAFPLDRLPQWAQDVAWALPTQHAVAIARALTNGGSLTTVLSNAAVLLVTCTILLVIPLRQLRRRVVV
jgi:lipooligosaccharide transport system permease protein